MYLSRSFARSNGLNKKCGEILGMGYNRTNGQACIKGRWSNFCFENGLEARSFDKFKFVPNRTLCSYTIPEGNCSKPNGKYQFSGKPSCESLESDSMNQNKFLQMTFKPYMFTSGHLCLPRSFVRDNGIKEGEEITLVDKDGVKWPSYVAGSNESERFYLAKGWRRFCEANRLTSGESFTLEFVRESLTTPMLKFCYKEKVKQPLQHLTISDHVKKVKQSILDTLIGVKQFQSELKIKEQSLEASLKDIDALGKRVLEINKILK